MIHIKFVAKYRSHSFSIVFSMMVIKIKYCSAQVFQSAPSIPITPIFVRYKAITSKLFQLLCGQVDVRSSNPIMGSYCPLMVNIHLWVTPHKSLSFPASSNVHCCHCGTIISITIIIIIVSLSLTTVTFTTSHKISKESARMSLAMTSIAKKHWSQFAQ